MVDIIEWTVTALLLLVSVGITTTICHGYGSLKWKEKFISLVILIIIVIQFYYLLLAANTIPTDSAFSLYRKACLQSNKGGKRPQDSTKHYDINPCFCKSPAVCYLSKSGFILKKNQSCPTDGSASCHRFVTRQNNLTNDYVDIPLYTDFRRNCQFAQGAFCTKSEPCDPCDREALPVWNSGRCRSCSSDFLGDCHFIPNVGPYCWAKKGSRVVVPCTRCCTVGDPLYINNTCY